MVDYRKQIKFFFFLISLVWIGSGVYEIVKVSFSNGIRILIFGCVFIIVLYLIQKYFMKMLALYNKNLDKSIKNNKRRRN